MRGTIVLGGAALGRWIMATYPPDIALLVIVLTTLFVAAGLIFTGRAIFRAGEHHSAEGDLLHLLLGKCGIERTGRLVIAAFFAGLLLSLPSRRPPPHSSS